MKDDKIFAEKIDGSWRVLHVRFCKTKNACLEYIRETGYKLKGVAGKEYLIAIKPKDLVKKRAAVKKKKKR